MAQGKIFHQAKTQDSPCRNTGSRGSVQQQALEIREIWISPTPTLRLSGPFVSETWVSLVRRTAGEY